MIMKKIHNKQAFTLIEVLVALFIFSIIAILTMRGLQTTLTAKQSSQRVLDVLAEIETAYSIIQQDIEQVINRNVKASDGGLKLAFLVPVDNDASEGAKASAESEDGFNRLEFTRTGVSSAIIKYRVSDLQRVAYYQKGDMLARHSWRQVDPYSKSLIDKRRLLTKVEDLKIFFIDAYGRETGDWQVRKATYPINQMQTSMELPRGIIFRFNIKEFGNLEWVFVLPQVLDKA